MNSGGRTALASVKSFNLALNGGDTSNESRRGYDSRIPSSGTNMGKTFEVENSGNA